MQLAIAEDLSRTNLRSNAGAKRWMISDYYDDRSFVNARLNFGSQRMPAGTKREQVGVANKYKDNR